MKIKEIIVETKEVDEQLEENTSVNMDAYKDAIQNAETPKKKSAKHKIEALLRKS